MPDLNGRILALALNPAWQHTLHFDHFAYGAINRAADAGQTFGGKGGNVAKAVVNLGGRVTVAQFAGGYTGDLLCAALDARGIQHLTVRTQAPTRTCVTVLPQDDGTMTELIEPSGAVSPSELTAMRELLTREMGAFGGVALSGSLPPGVPDSFYADVATLALDRALVLLDAWSKVAVPALEAGVSVLKINVHELAELTGCTDLEEGTRACLERYPVQAVAVTCGPDPAVLVTRRTAWRVPVPEATHVVSPLGAGDVVAGVMLHDLVSGTAADPRSREWDQRVLRAFALGLGCASASAQTASPSEFDPALGRGLAIAALEGAEVLRQ